jgi:hypothetical protein
MEYALHFIGHGFHPDGITAKNIPLGRQDKNFTG